MPVTVRSVSATLCFVGPVERPLQVVQVRLAGLGGATGPVSVSATAGPPSVSTPAILAPSDRDAGPSATNPDPDHGSEHGDERVVEVGLDAYRHHPPGSSVPVTVTVTHSGRTDTHRAAIETAEPGWTMWMVPHFHYDPVWWNTQAAYAQRWDDLPAAQATRGAYQQTAFSLVRAYLDATREDPDYRFVLAEVDYLKPYWDSCPADRAYLRRLLTEGRLEIVGGTYNEPNTNLTSPESTARNAVYGMGFTREVMGAAPDTAWQLDVFGHDPQFPGMMADAGLTTSSWARGPFHQWGPILNPGGEPGDPRRMQFPSEFRWISPGGGGLVTSYMADHYSIGYWMDSAPTLADAEEHVYRVFCELRAVAATRNVLLPVGTDHAMPNKWVTEIARDWAGRYVWPRFVCATPREYFAAVRAESDNGAALWPQTRDMNPVYTGKDVSYIDVKQAQRAGENTLVDAEKFATLACLLTGASYPDTELDLAWRQLVFGAHHDGITGTFSDQVYLDLLAGWREAHDLARTVHDRATDVLASTVDTTLPDDPAARPLVVFNSLSWPRTDLVTTRVVLDRPGVASVAVCAGPDGQPDPVPAVAEAIRRHPDGSLAGATITFLASDVPGLGYRTYWL
ncbi:MAG TPA: alpha-mannosidase, partial [Mycobacteriales bacterium]|nr:alpha-mannosidase [Mycobacteriales bacterium]